MKSRLLIRGVLAGAVLLLLAAPVYPQGKKGGGKGEKTKYPFSFIFDGGFTLLEGSDSGAPWAVESGAGGTGNIGGSGNLVTNGAIPLYADRLADIGDADCGTCSDIACGCSQQLAGEVPSTEWVTFLPTESDQGGYDVKLHFTFCVDCLDPGEIVYTVQAFGLTDGWNPLSNQFCQVIDFTTVRMWQYSPTIRHRQKNPCSDYFATCEADWTDLIDLTPEEFKAVIWRAELGDSPPADCYQP